jgi:hypothetical protein
VSRPGGLRILQNAMVTFARPRECYLALRSVKALAESAIGHPVTMTHASVAPGM